MAKESISDVQFVDELYFSALSNENEDQLFPISDSKYAEELQFQEVLMSSLIASQNPNTDIEKSPSSDTPEPITAKESGESSQCFCEICAEKKEADEMFRIDPCSHSYCSICIAKHVTIKIRESATEPVVACPGFDCDGVLELSVCRQRMPGEVAAMWDDLLCEAAIAVDEKFYCPFRDCSAMLVNRRRRRRGHYGMRVSVLSQVVLREVLRAVARGGWVRGVWEVGGG
ncbi:hypothetical protein Acr_16g0006040 [Actinidia rufa]|uniref:RING-type domain-containing protein n=1 Tax=Actinidia rufa TaxID=165716 RepID=A0A7J0G0L8_9ERIC|nr:hypothetical protein Acr_16g0006040 [Actinidia rufa]